MASWKSAVYVLLGVIVLIVVILLNFDYLPKRRLSEELEFTVKGIERDSLQLGSHPTPKASTNTLTEAHVPPLTISQYIEKVTAWNCTTMPVMDGYPELTVDEFGKIDWNCTGFPRAPEGFPENVSKSLCYEYDDPFKCVWDPLHCKHKYESSTDKRFPVRPVYGQYAYLPKSIWLSAVLHGGVAFLYHPCTDEKLKQQLKKVAVSCLKRHIITPYENLSPCQPIAMVAWGCFYTTAKINESESKAWIQQRAMQAPASHVSENGQFDKGLLHSAVTVSDKHETHICPPNRRSLISQDEGNEIVIEESLSVHKFDRYNAAWALGCLIFLCLILGVVLIYTQPWHNRNYLWTVDDYNSNTTFSLLKPRRFSWKRRTLRNKKSLAYSHLLSSIPEEIEDDI